MNLTLEIQRSSSHDCLSISQKTVTTVTTVTMFLNGSSLPWSGSRWMRRCRRRASSSSCKCHCPGDDVLQGLDKAWLSKRRGWLISLLRECLVIDVQWFYKWLQTIPNSYCLDIYTVYTLQLSQFRNPKKHPRSDIFSQPSVVSVQSSHPETGEVGKEGHFGIFLWRIASLGIDGVIHMLG